MRAVLQGPAAWRGARYGGAFLLTGLAALLPIMTDAQESDPLAPRLQFSIGQQIALDNGDLIGITPLNLDWNTGTRSDVLQLSLSVPIEENDPDADRTFSISDPNARLFYRRFVRNSSIETELTYRETSLDREIFYDDETDRLLTLDPGKAINSSVRLGYVFGAQSKLGGEIGLRYAQRDYVDTIDTDLIDSETSSADLRLYLEPIPTLRARLIASARETNSDAGGTDSRSSRFGAGASLQLDKVTNLDAELAQTHIRREDDGDGSIEEVTGPSLQLGLTRARPDGEWSLSFASDPGTAGRRDRVMLGRSLETPGYNLSAKLGVTRFDGSIDPVYQLGYQRELSDVSKIEASLNHQAVTDDDGDEALNTSLTASYSRQLNPLSSLSSSIRYRETAVQSGTAEDARSVAFSMTYNRALDSNISLVAGASIVRSDSDRRDKDDDERVYLGLTRAFNWLP